MKIVTMSDLRYIKGVRTRYRAVLQTELVHGKKLLLSDIESCIKEELLGKVNKSIKTLEVYSEKLEIKSKELCCAIGDTDEDLLSNVLDEDGTLAEEIFDCCINLEELKEILLVPEKKKEESVETSEKMEELVRLQTEMQEMVINQMEQQRLFFEKQEKIKHEQTAVKLPKIEMASFNGDKIRWTEFWDSFECTVHSNKKLSGIE